MKKQWMLRQSGLNWKVLAQKAKVSELVACILANRNVKSPEEIMKFMQASLGDLYEASKMKDMTIGVEMLKNAIEMNKKIVVYGDYDVDGVISTYILYSALSKCKAQVSFYIPDRESEGYGMNSERIKTLKSEGYEVILTCDNGIAAFEQIKLAKELGFEVIVTDHHDVPFTQTETGMKDYLIPPADAVINPKQHDCQYPFKVLCGAGIAFKLSQFLYKQLGLDENLAFEYIEYAAIATICDVVDLIGENRIIAQNGLRMINKSNNVGLKALIKQTALEGKKISAYHIGFIIGPCINATGRLESAKLSVELFLSKNTEDATNLAKRLFDLNTERQELTTKSVEDIIQTIEINNMSEDKVLVVYNKDVHESIAGIVAGRIKEKYNVPTIILTSGKEMPKGSGRSIEGYNMFEELLKCKELLSKFGGHPMAAGLSLSEENIPKLRKKLLENCSLSEDDLIPKVRIDCKLNLSNITYTLIEDLQKLEPYGKGNSSPLFAEKGVEITKAYFMGKEKNIIKLFCRIKGSFKKIDAISFEHGEEFKEMIKDNYGDTVLDEILAGSDFSIPFDIIFYPSINEYNGNTNIQLIIKEMRISNS